MLLKVSEHIAECLRMAEDARQRADQTIDPALSSDYLWLEVHWFKLAENYRFVEQLGRFLNDADRESDGLEKTVTARRR